MVYVALTISLLAFIFTIASFWWLNARTGSIEAAAPGTYAFADNESVRLRLPLALFNSGAKSLIVSDLRVLGAGSGQMLEWITTRDRLRPESDDGFAFATPFAVPGRKTRELIAEFGDEREWKPEPSSCHNLRLQARVHPSKEWRELVAFEWIAPPLAEIMRLYIAHRNAPSGEQA